MIAVAKRFLDSYRAHLIAGFLPVAGFIGAAWASTLLLPLDRPFLVMLGTVFVATGLTVYLATRYSRPIDKLTAAARSMAAGNLRVPVPLESTGLTGMSSALADLRIQMRKRLAESEAEQRDLRAVFDGMTDAILLLDDGHIVFANRATSRLFRSPALGWRARHLDETELPAPVRSVVLDNIEASEETVEEYGPDPSGRTLRVSVIPLTPAEGHRRTLVVVSDTTERTKLERMRRDFVANASHELKTPTTAIHLLAESVVDAIEDGDPDQALDFAGRIEQESSRLSRLVKDLLDLSRLESTPAPGTITDIREVASNTVIGHRATAAERGLELLLDDEAVTGEGVFAKADPTDVAVALDNLLDNAITYTEEGSVTLRIEADADQVRVAVCDTGLGIPPEDLPRVFERFYRVDPARARYSGGTGLGLALVRHVVERASGSVDVTSTPGAGSTFTISLPRQT